MRIFWIVLLSIIFAVSIVLFFLSKKIAKDNERLFVILKVSTALVAVACVMIVIFVDGFQINW